MTFRPAVVLLALQLGAVPAFAQRDGGFQRSPSRGRDAAQAQAPAPQGQQGGRARERQGAPAPAAEGQRSARAREREVSPVAPAPQEQDRGGARFRERNPQVRNSEAVPRPSAVAQPPDQSGGNVLSAQPRQGDQQRQAIQRQAIPRQGNGFQAGGAQTGGAPANGSGNGRVDGSAQPRYAVPRQGQVVQHQGRTNVYAAPHRYYAPNAYYGGRYAYGRVPVYHYTPRFVRPYVYGPLGPGYFYYGSYGWYPRATFYYDGGYYGRGYGYDSGEVRLQVQPRFAEVYVDGYYAGTVDDFDGTFQSLRLESGPYHLEIVAPGYDTLEVDLRVAAGQKITYRGELRPEF